MHIQIHIPRPWQTMFALLLMFFWLTGPFGLGGSPAPAADAHDHDNGVGGITSGVELARAQQGVERERIRQAVLSQKEEILRYQLHVLEEEALRTKDPRAASELAEHRKVLIAILTQKKESETLLTASLASLWDAQGTSYSRVAPDKPMVLLWPVEPKYGISAYFEDDGYEERFGMPHHALDIPIEQGSVVRAPADGTVAKVSLNGLGYSYITIDHAGGVQTVYGHVSGSLVQEGDTVRAGAPIALSGGRPGSEGAGLLTTGPHLHFVVRQDGVLVDPLKYLATMEDGYGS
jgi:murein DD-endopeptidase MepM/ murein hydrolase activator NlpD